MTDNLRQIYFDEAGFTGNNLLDSEQPVFVYAGVAMPEHVALRIQTEAISRYRIKSQELKGATLTKSEKGHEAISWLLSQVNNYARVMVANKSYALCGKFFEHIFEPVLSEHNSLFYATGFHKFIATLLYVGHRSNDPHVDRMLTNFMRMMRNMDPEQLPSVLSPLDHFRQSDPFGLIFAFALCHHNRIKSEIDVMRDADDIADWPLELSMTALHWLLASWGEESDALEVYCDESKPISEAHDFFEVLIGREDKAYLEFGDYSGPSYIYNLAGPINLVDSKVSPGVQIADILSSSIAYMYKNPDENISRKWRNILDDMPVNHIIPDLDNIDLGKSRSLVNSMILRELVDRSVKGHNLFEGMDIFISCAEEIASEASL